jgi:hypothetical protein
MSSDLNNRMSARHIAASAVAALFLTASPAFAASDAGIWKVNAAKSTFNANSATLTIQRVESASSNAGSFIVISGAGVYRVTGATASESRGLKPVDFQNMTRTGDAVLIGTYPHSKDSCGFHCRAGLPEKVRTVTFRVVKNGEQQIKDMLAYESANW